MSTFTDIPDLPTILTVKELATLCRVAPNTIYESYARGEIPGARRFGRSIRFHRDTVIQWFRGAGLGSPSSGGKG